VTEQRDGWAAMNVTRTIGAVISTALLFMVGCASHPKQYDNSVVEIAYYKDSDEAIAGLAFRTLRQHGIETVISVGNAGWGNVFVPSSQAVRARKILREMLSGLGSKAKSFRVFDQVFYHNVQYDFTFFLPAIWQGYSVLVQQWEGRTYLAAADKVVVTEHGPVIVLRHPQWKAGDHYQDIPIEVFTRSQWEAYHQGRFSIGAGGIEEEIGHNPKYVFATSSRFNADDTVKGWKEADDIVERNRAANAPHLHPI